MRHWFLIIALSFQAQAAEFDAIQMMVDGFGNNCTINGNWTQAATQNIAALVTILETVKDDPNCQTVAGAITNLRATEEQLSEFNRPHSYIEVEIRGLRTRRSEILNLLAATTDPVEEEFLNEELRYTHLELAQMRGRRRHDGDNRQRERLANTSAMIARSTQNVLSQLVQNERCWDERPNILSEVAGLGTAISQSVALGMGTGGMSTVVGAGIQLGATLVDYIKQRRRTRRISRVAIPAQTTALSCALETMTNQWCDARDAIDAIDIVARANFDSALEDTDTRRSLRLLDRQVPMIQEWLEEVRLGSTPSNSAVAERLADLFEDERALRTIKPQVIGRINEEQRNFVGSEEELWRIVRSVAIRIVDSIYPSRFGPGGPPNPMADVFPRAEAPYRLIGIDPDRIPVTGEGLLDFDQFNPFIESNQGLVTIDESFLMGTLLREFLKWYESADERFQIRRRSIIFDDPLRIFSNAERISFSGERRGNSVKRSIGQLIEFLAARKPDANGPYRWMVNIYSDTLNRLRRLNTVIENINDPEVGNFQNCSLESMLIQPNPIGFDEEAVNCPLAALKQIENIANLENGSTFLTQRLEDFLRIIIEMEMMSGESMNRDRSLQFLAANDIVDRLLFFSTHNSWETLRADARHSQTLVQMTLDNYIDAFGRQIRQSLDMLDDAIDRFDEEEDGPSTFSKTVMCLNLISTPKWSSSIGLYKCLGIQSESVIPGAPRSPEFSRRLFREDFADRICLYRDYRRRIDVMQSLRR